MEYDKYTLMAALTLAVEWFVECGFGYDNIPEEYERYKSEIENMSYNEGLRYIILSEAEKR